MEIGAIVGLILLWVFTVQLARKEGSKAAQLEAIKAELKKQLEEREREARITNSVNNLTDDDVRERLQDISAKWP